jgi:hypothetical protein
MEPRSVNEITAADVLEWRRVKTPVIRVRTDRDAIPGGLALAMLPVFVRWHSSAVGFGPDDYYSLGNVAVTANPVSGMTTLAGLKVYADSVESVEFVMVISKVAGRETPGGHALLRFRFREDRRAELLGPNGDPVSNDPGVDDIVISWEAWRPPLAGWDPFASFDPSSYALTPRCSVGAVRCLSDSVLDRPWHCYPLKLPDVPHACDELLYVSLALADAVARRTVIGILDERIEKGQEMPEDYPVVDTEEWAALNEIYRNSKIPEDPIQDILRGKIRYQILERSCITMALQSVSWAQQRVHERAGLDDPPPIRVTPESMPSFLDKLASGKRSSLLLRAPAALHWLMSNQTVLPSKAHELLDEANLLHRDHGRIRKARFDNRKKSPYGVISDHLIY